jgi:hypothetical protein
MARTLVNGATVAIAATYGTPSAISAITNATPAVATLAAAHGIIVGDIAEITSGWQRLDGRVARASAVATNDVSLEGIDTTDVTRYPVGTGIGSAREILTWADIAQIIDFKQSGGVQQFLTYQYLVDDLQSKIPTFRDPVDFTLVTHDDITLAHFAIVLAAQETAAQRAFRITTRDGKKWYGSGYWSIQQTPEFGINDILKRTINLTVSGSVTQYAS